MTIKSGLAQDGSSALTPARRAGIKVGTKVVIISAVYGVREGFKRGDIVTLKEDDGTYVPLFENASKTEDFWMDLADVELFIEAQEQTQPTSTASLMPDPVVTSPAPMSDIQRQALICFNTMLHRAKHVAIGAKHGEELFYTGYGICDNISRCKPSDADTEQLSMIKDNLIRRVPSYSGNYHYPVSCPENPKNVDAADNAWSNHRNKWTGAYGANRITQLEELIHIIEHKWKEEYAKDMTPSQRVGLIEGVSVVKRNSNEKLYRFVRDDRSSDPYFESLTEGDQVSIDLRRITILAMEPVEGDTRSVADFLAAIEAEQKAKTDMELQIAELQQALAKVGSTIAMLDYGLRVNHRVQRLS